MTPTQRETALGVDEAIQAIEADGFRVVRDADAEGYRHYRITAPSGQNLGGFYGITVSVLRKTGDFVRHVNR